MRKDWIRWEKGECKSSTQQIRFFSKLRLELEIAIRQHSNVKEQKWIHFACCWQIEAAVSVRGEGLQGSAADCNTFGQSTLMHSLLPSISFSYLKKLFVLFVCQSCLLRFQVLRGTYFLILCIWITCSTDRNYVFRTSRQHCHAKLLKFSGI